MTEDDRTGHSSAATADRVASVLAPVKRRERRSRGLFGRRKRNRRIRWLRLLAILVPLSFLAVISMVFGMVLAFAPQLGPLAAKLQTNFKNGLNSEILAAPPGHHVLGILTDRNQFFLPDSLIPLVMDHAIVAIEDKRFYTEPGIDWRGIARAFINDVFHTGNGIQGGSTITEQFIKNALNEQNHRTIFEKLREAALAFQLTHVPGWTKERILAEYLNTSYFGNGAYGIEAAARAYFGNDPASNLYNCGTQPNVRYPSSLCVTNLTADEAAMLAGMVASPSALGNDLFTDPAAVESRRNLVLKDMAEQGYLTQPEYLSDSQISLPPANAVQSPSEANVDPSAGYFVNWIENQLTSQENKGLKVYYGPKVYSAGYTIHTTLDWYLQKAAQDVVRHILPSNVGGPAASLVAIDNKTGEVKAMVGGYDFTKNAFNLATTAERQPGSAFKVFDLAVALEQGYKSTSTIKSAPYTYTLQANPFGDFTVINDERSYFNAYIPLWEALAYSDNSVFSRLGLAPNVGQQRIADLAHSFGISTTISVNPSMVIGGLHIGVTPIDMAHAYETIANDGRLTSGTLATNVCAGGGTQAFNWEEKQPPPHSCPGPVGIDYITQNGTRVASNEVQYFPSPGFTPALAKEEIGMMHDVIAFGTGTAAAIPGIKAWGKTGTTTGYVDAWFVGSTPQVGSADSMTVAIWVGYPNRAKSMAKDYGGKPVYGGTYPALIWKDYVLKALAIYARRAAGLPSVPSSSSGSTSQAGSTSTTGTTASSGATSPGSATGAAGTANTGGASTGATNTPSGATTPTPPPSAGTVTSGGGSSAPGTTAPTTGTTAPTTGTPPPTTQGGGVAAPGGGTTAPSG